MRDQFEKLAKDFCALVKLPDAAQVIAGQPQGAEAALVQRHVLRRGKCSRILQLLAVVHQGEAQKYGLRR